jgi:peptidoglycan biosynthesis protein MviN/MurJ (putative lipid II flippase)
MVGLNLVLNLVLIWTPLRETGLAWSTAFCAVVQCIVLARILRIRHGQGVDAGVLRSALRSLLCAGVMAAVLWAVDLAVDLGDGWSARAVELAILTVTGGLAFLGSAALLRMPEMKWALGRSA